MNFKIYIICDKIEKFYSEAIKEYEKRLKIYCKIELIPLKNKDKLLKSLSSKSYKILVSTKGIQISSVELATKINTLAISGNSDISIIIGADVPPDEILAISTMDMTIGLQATTLFEQIYRAYRILNNQAYHK